MIEEGCVWWKTFVAGAWRSDSSSSSPSSRITCGNAEYVAEPYPNRAAVIVSGFAREEMLVEMVAYAALPVTP